MLFGATTPLTSRLAGDMTAPTLAGLLYVGAALAVAPLHSTRAVDRTAMRRAWPRLAVAVGAGGLFGPLLLVMGMSRTPAPTTSLLLNLELVATVVLAWLLFREHVGRRVVAGTCFVVTAAVVLTWSGAPELRVGALLIAAACVFWGLDNCVTAQLDQLAPQQVTFAKGTVAGSTNLIIGLLLEPRLPPWWTLAAALALGAVGYGMSITLWVRGARDLGAARGQLVFSAAPFAGVVVAWAALQDPVRTTEITGLVLGAIGVSFVLRSGHAHEHLHDPQEHDHEHEHDAHHQHHHPRREAGHAHRHRHEPVAHTHPHVPDLHHRH